MYLSKIHVENYRLLRDVTIDLDPSLTLFVGKNNTGKTSILNVIEFLLSDRKSLPFDDYPLECRVALYDAIKTYWNDEDEGAFIRYCASVPITKIRLTIDYSEDDETYGELGNFILDLDDENNNVIIEISFDAPHNIKEILFQCKERYEGLNGEDRDSVLTHIVQDVFPSLFQMNIVAVNPINPEDIMARSRNDLKSLFCVKTIKAERTLDETEAGTDNPLRQIMRKLFNTEFGSVEEGLRPALEAFQSIISDVNFNVQTQVDSHMDTIVSPMQPIWLPRW